jgi:DNA-binding NarL/FixJ family response regulator
LAPTELPMPWR